MSSLVVEADGGSRGNPGIAAARLELYSDANEAMGRRESFRREFARGQD